jgi:GNAT superfamily N-acetyltransferase
MKRITHDKVTLAIRSLFRTDEMVASRCFTVLDGTVNNGTIIVDNLVDPNWAIVKEPMDNALFLGGNLDGAIIAEVFAVLRKEGDVLIGMLPNDPRLGYLPANPDYDGLTLEFYDRPIGRGLDAYLHRVPADYLIKRLDRDLVMRTEWGPNDVKLAGGIKNWEKTCFGYCLMYGNEILSEATVGPSAQGLYEPGVFTKKEQRGKGYATMVVARLIQEIEIIGGQTYWNCAKQNIASGAVARKLGYRVEKEFRCLAWNKIN